MHSNRTASRPVTRTAKHIGGVDLVCNSLEWESLLYQGQGEAIGREPCRSGVVQLTVSFSMILVAPRCWAFSKVSMDISRYQNYQYRSPRPSERGWKRRKWEIGEHRGVRAGYDSRQKSRSIASRKWRDPFSRKRRDPFSQVSKWSSPSWERSDRYAATWPRQIGHDLID